VRAPFIIVGIVVLTLATALVARGLHLVGVQQGYAPAQPIAFPHKVHAGDNKIPCLYCHSAARTSRHAGIPSINHSQHVQSGVECQRCHGPIEQMDRVRQFSPLTMGWCLTCHREHANLPTGTLERSALSLAQKPRPTAGLDCTSCHY
jgi:hypothetical protein